MHLQTVYHGNSVYCFEIFQKNSILLSEYALKGLDLNYINPSIFVFLPNSDIKPRGKQFPRGNL